ncbi:MAG: two-component regulator propeller domain-containing protein [Chitinophagales bacterium]
MFWLKNWIITVMLLLEGICGRPQKIFFEQLTTAEGLPSDYVNCVFRDSKGYLWIGTDKGACRYDGNTFLYLNKDNGLASNFVYCITEDLQNNIWFGTFEGGLCKYDGRSVSAIPLDSSEFKNIFKILFNTDGSLFIVSGREHLFYLKNLSAPPEKVTGYGCYNIFPIESQRFLFSGERGLLHLLEKNNNEFFVRPLWEKRSEGDIILADSYKNRFAVKEGDSLILYVVSGNTIRREKKYFLPSVTKETARGGYITNENELWIKMQNGVLYKNENNDPKFFSNENGLGSNHVTSVYEDDEKNIYITTFGGGVKIWQRLYIQEFKMEGKVNSIFTNDKAAYITTTQGIYKYKPGRKCTEYKNLRSGDITDCYQSPDGRFYLGTYNSFLKLPDESVLSSITKAALKKYEIPLWTGVSGFLSVGQNELLVSTYGEGIDKYNQRNKIIDQMNPDNRRMGSRLVEFLKPLKNSYAALSFNAGITLTTADEKIITLTKKDGLLSNSVYSVFQEKENEIWIGTLDGLNLYDGNRIIKTFSYREGFIGSKTLCIFLDSQQRFWVVSDKYLHLLEGDRLRPIRSHPLLYSKNSINRAEYNKATGILYLGLTDAFMVVDIKKIIPDSIIHAPQLVSVIDGDSTLSWKGKFNIPGPGKITFRFTNQHYPLAKGSDIYYMLKGYDEDWRLLDHSLEVNYPKLSSGKYELLAKTVNPDYYTSEEISLIKFEILPPLWKRNWFIMLSSIFLLGLFFYTGRQISKKRYERKIRQLNEQHKLQLERERIARELHDNVGSQLTYLINKIDDEQELLADKEEAGHLGNFAREAMRELRETIWALDKKEILPEELGNKVQQLLRLYKNKDCEIEMNWQHDNGRQTPLNSLEALNIYRIIQEAINNAVKYSEASEIKISADFTWKNFRVLIEDNGKGFDVQHTEKGYGLQNMQKRAEEMNGQLQINTAPGKGTIVDLQGRRNSTFFLI